MAKKLRELLILRGHNCYCIGSISHHKGDTLGLPPPRYGEAGRNPAESENPSTHERPLQGPGRSPCHPAVVAGTLKKGEIHNR